MCKILMYAGAMKGKLRCIFKRRQVKNMYREMLDEVNLRYFENGYNGEYNLIKAIEETNDVYERNEMNMYLFLDKEQHLVNFAFRDMGMNDRGYYKVVG